MEIIERAVESESIADLRLVEALIHAMSEPYIGDIVSERAIPKLGRALVAPIRRRLNVKGKTIDGRRLKALVAAEKTGARDVLELALREGSAEVREAALDAIADHVPGVAEFEPLVLELIEKEKSKDARRAGVRALAGYGSDRSLSALIAAIDVEATREAASEALSKSKHPEAARKLLARLGEVLTEPVAKKPKKEVAPAKPAKKKPAGESPKEARKAIVSALLTSLAGLADPAIASTAIELIEEFGDVAARAAIQSANPEQLARIAAFLDGDDPDRFPGAVAAALKLGSAEAFKRFSAVFKAPDRESKKGQARLAAVVLGLDPAADGRWADFLLDIVSKEPRNVASHAVEPLGRTRDRRAVKPLLKLLDGEKGSRLAWTIITALGMIGDPSAVDSILAHAAGNDYGIRWGIKKAILDINDKSSVAKVREAFVALKKPDDWNNWYLRSLLSALEQRFPGE
jgi:HEAT repeat protein